ASGGALFLGHGDLGLFRSLDEGATCQAGAASNARRLDRIAVAGARLVGRETGVRGRWISDDRGVSWAAEPDAENDDVPTPNGLYVRALVADPSNPNRLWVGGERTPRFYEPLPVLWRSDDAGQSWQPISVEGGPKEVVRGVALDPADPNRIYAAGEQLF